jgi:hypothetical protein
MTPTCRNNHRKSKKCMRVQYRNRTTADPIRNARQYVGPIRPSSSSVVAYVTLDRHSGQVGDALRSNRIKQSL